MIDKHIFRAYDIRGTYPDQLNASTAELIGKGFGTFLRRNLSLKDPKVAVGLDARTHGVELHDAFIQGLRSAGVNVTDCGLSPSPYLYFCNTEGKFDGGCNITASHNPKQYNGFKLITQRGHALFGVDLQTVYQIIEKGDFAVGEGALSTADFYESYLKRLRSLFTPKRPLKVVVDTANGVAGRLYPKVIAALGHEVVELYVELDGTFPNHEPDPIVESNLAELKKKVLETHADIGLAFDGDGDRVSLVSEAGEFINSDKTLMLLAKDALSRNPGRSVVFTVSNSQSLFDLVKQLGGEPVMCKVGHSYVESAMNEYGAILGGEQSGHFFLPEGYYPYDDALVTACRALKIVGDSGEKTSALFHEFPRTFQESEMRPYCADNAKFAVLERIQTYFKDMYPNTMMDGIRLDFGKGAWAGIRVSNTSPCMSITMEAQSESHLREIKEIVLRHLKSYAEIRWE